MELSIPLLFFFFSILHIPTTANFDASSVAGLYRQQIGDGKATCPDLITFSQNGLVHPASTLTLDDIPCRGNSQLTLQQTPISGNGLVNFFKKNNVVGQTYFGGAFSSPIACGPRKVEKNYFFLFFTPTVTFTITWEDILGKSRPLELNSKSVYTFEKNTDYLIINNRCLFTRDTNKRRACFPKDAKVDVYGKGILPIHLVQKDDLVKVSGSKYSPLFGFTHRDEDVLFASFIKVYTDDSHVFTASRGHLVMINNQFRPMESVRVGDLMMNDQDEFVRVVRIRRDVISQGLYNPQTLDGTIVIDGLVASTYTTAIDHIIAHALLAPVRAISDYFSFTWMEQLPLVTSFGMNLLATKIR